MVAFHSLRWTLLLQVTFLFQLIKFAMSNTICASNQPAWGYGLGLISHASKQDTTSNCFEPTSNLGLNTVGRNCARNSENSCTSPAGSKEVAAAFGITWTGISATQYRLSAPIETDGAPGKLHVEQSNIQPGSDCRWLCVVIQSEGAAAEETTRMQDAPLKEPAVSPADRRAPAAAGLAPAAGPAVARPTTATPCPRRGGPAWSTGLGLAPAVPTVSPAVVAAGPAGRRAGP